MRDVVVDLINKTTEDLLHHTPIYLASLWADFYATFTTQDPLTAFWWLRECVR